MGLWASHCGLEEQWGWTECIFLTFLLASGTEVKRIPLGYTLAERLPHGMVGCLPREEQGEKLPLASKCLTY